MKYTLESGRRIFLDNTPLVRIAVLDESPLANKEVDDIAHMLVNTLNNGDIERRLQAIETYIQHNEAVAKAFLETRNKG